MNMSENLDPRNRPYRVFVYSIYWLCLLALCVLSAIGIFRGACAG